MTRPATPPNARHHEGTAALIEQLRGDFGALVSSLTVLVGPDEELGRLATIVDGRARSWASCLASDDDDVAAAAARDLVGVLWPRGVSSDGEQAAQWWRTPLGRAIARAVGHPSAESVSYAVAGAMLGVSKQRIGTLVHAGTLRRGRDGGVASDSIRAAVAHRYPPSDTTSR